MNRITTIAGLAFAAIVLAGCGLGSVLEGERPDRAQGFPANYKPEILAFFKTYLNDPVAVKDAEMAEPVLRPVGSQQRFVSCLKFNPREPDGSYRGARVKAVVYIDGRLDHVIDEPGDICNGASYAAFPELQAMTR